MTTAVQDKIERQVVLKATPERVWRALTDIKEFAQWFGVTIRSGEFKPGARVECTSVLDDCAGELFFFDVIRMDAPHTLVWRWHPGFKDPAMDYSKEPLTEVVFRLEAAEGGTRLTIVESGFDKIRPERRLKVFGENSHGWDEQIRFIQKHVER